MLQSAIRAAVAAVAVAASTGAAVAVAAATDAAPVAAAGSTTNCV